MFCTDFMSMVTVCGSGTGTPSNRECQKDVLLPSSTFPAGYPVATSLAATVQPVRGSTGGGTSPSTVSSDADDHGPRLPASVLAVSRA
jgi:hypothetical protein